MNYWTRVLPHPLTPKSIQQMLKRALGGHAREEELTDEDNLSQHSDSVMDYRRRKTKQGNVSYDAEVLGWKGTSKKKKPLAKADALNYT